MQPLHTRKIGGSNPSITTNALVDKLVKSSLSKGEDSLGSTPSKGTIYGRVSRIGIAAAVLKTEGSEMGV